MKKLMLWLGAVATLVVAAALFGPRAIAPPQRVQAVPFELTARAVIPGIPGARYFVGLDIEPFVRDVLAAREREHLARSGVAELPPTELLAISGGGDKGAFGASLLYGWTQSGTRPTFKAVTGVSTGALIAPFAFAGQEYDEVLKQVYTSVAPTDIAQPRSVLAAIQNDGMADNQPLWSLISRFVDEPFLDKVAAEHAKGRLLLVGTTDLDARQPVIWNMGVIASSRARQALELFRQILLASAAIPGAFPPTMVAVEVDGVPYQEMHVDGGASAQVFLYRPSLRRTTAALGESIEAASTRPRDSQLLADAERRSRRAADDQYRGASARLTDPHAGDRRPVPDLSDDAARWARLQPRVHRREVRLRRQEGAVRDGLHGQAVRLRP